MAESTDGRRARLSRERVLRSAVAIADAGGIGSLTIRSLATELGVKPMSVYHHVANKEEILDSTVDLVFSEIELPVVGGDWQVEMRRRADSARRVLRRHPWAIGLLELRTHPGLATLKHHDAVIGTLRAAGFSLAMTAHAYALIDAYVYGFALSEAVMPISNPHTVAAMVEQVPADTYPHLAELAGEHLAMPDYDYGQEFQFGLDVILTSLETSLTADAVASS